MKKLIFIRHGRAEEQSAEISDFERSLTLKGKTIAKEMARKFREKENSPGNIITSPAFRALETAIIFAEEFGIEPEKIIINSNLYYKMDIHYLYELLSHVSEDTESITLFGHNPSFTEMANSLSKEGCDFMTKCGVVGICFNVSTWAEVRHNTGKVEYYLNHEKAL
ncbi:MAG: histidine phosphatase family protein [Bacteroidota bacterium]